MRNDVATYVECSDGSYSREFAVDVVVEAGITLNFVFLFELTIITLGERDGNHDVTNVQRGTSINWQQKLKNIARKGREKGIVTEQRQ